MTNRSKAGLIGLVCVSIIFLCFPISQADTVPPGDANGDGTTNVSDAVRIINYIFVGGSAPVNFSAADVVNDCAINISDAVRIIRYVFDDDIDYLESGCEHSETTGICVSYGTKDSPPDTNGYVVIEVLGNDLHIHHMGAFYNCGLQFNMEYSFNGNVITAMEFDTGEPADCYCYFDHLESVYFDLENGTYTVIVIGISYEPGEGDTLAVETIVVDDDYGIIGYSDGGCWPETPTMLGADITYLYNNGVLTMEHDSAVFNCAAYLIVAFEQQADTLRFFEINISDEYVYCICPFDITASVAGILPGSYVAEIWAIEPMDMPPVLTDRRNIVLE